MQIANAIRICVKGAADAPGVFLRPEPYKDSRARRSTRRTLLRFIVLSMATVGLLQPAAGYQAPETSSTTTLPFPGGLTATVTLNKTQAGGLAWSAPAGTVGFNSFGGATSAMLSPANFPVTTPAQSLFLMPANCNLTAGTTIICANQGTVTVSFNREVTNPVLHLSGLGSGPIDLALAA